MDVQPEWIVGGGLVALALVALAFAVGRRSGAGPERVRELESRLEVAAQERERVESELRGYRERVAEHFSETSQQLHDLTVQYRSVYEHLAKGASELCPESFEQLQGGLGLDALPEESPPFGERADRSAGDRGLDASAPLAGADPSTPEEAEGRASEEPAKASGSDAGSDSAEEEKEEERRAEAARAD